MHIHRPQLPQGQLAAPKPAGGVLLQASPPLISSSETFSQFESFSLTTVVIIYLSRPQTCPAVTTGGQREELVLCISDRGFADLNEPFQNSLMQRSSKPSSVAFRKNWKAALTIKAQPCNDRRWRPALMQFLLFFASLFLRARAPEWTTGKTPAEAEWCLGQGSTGNLGSCHPCGRCYLERMMFK